MAKSGFLEKFLEIIFPASIYCITCGSIIDGTRTYELCDSCAEKLHWVKGKTCDKCGKLLEEENRHDFCYDCMNGEHYFHRGFTCCQYGLYERSIMMDYKYRDKSYLGKILGDILYDRILAEEIHPDLIIPVPIHKDRFKTRGYNQTEIMARRLAKNMVTPIETKALVRNENTEPMKGLSVFERQENVKNAFSLLSDSEHRLSGKNILLIDDIYTTGSTADSCAKVLRREGLADKVYLLTFAAGGNPLPNN